MSYIGLAGGGSGAPQDTPWELYCTLPCNIAVDRAVSKCVVLARSIQARDAFHFVSNTSAW
eukprot:CAMPEP_0118875422 /NCGR_PEP_ID=MMETSP1163-20130328/16505_1 /TAXON_ID=124430 /ORGANISM="Phaeomonas parva, Strain CCMP2877" /LENGTH=60 /DNA_ID=CAMNT_0006810929 /DNA_START=12 /DNA_END=194 /DNA_ORIENTATION=-